jgi:hypothetical protein
VPSSLALRNTLLAFTTAATNNTLGDNRRDMAHVVEGKGFFKEATVEDFPAFDVVTVNDGMQSVVPDYVSITIAYVCTDTLILDAFKALVSHGIHSAPVYSRSTKKYM